MVSRESEEMILYKKAGAIAILTINRPEHRNALVFPMLRETGRILAAVAEDTDVRVLILTGAGSSFCPGADIQDKASGPGDPDRRSKPEDFRVPVLLHQMPAITIAAINGACAGAGMGWAAACDFRYAVPSAKFNTAFLDVGVAGDMGMPWTLPRIIGAGRARELLFMPRKFDAEEAYRIGLVSGIFPEEAFTNEVLKIAERISKIAPLALRAMKSNFIEAEEMGLRSYIALETARHLPMFATYDTQEAFTAKLEKREPRFLGR